VLAVVLQRQIVAQVGAGAGGGSLGGVPDGAWARVAGPLATAFAHTYWWAMAMTALAIIPAAVLAVTERRAARERDREAAAAEHDATGAAVADGATPPPRDRVPRPGHAPARLR
jgi:hypothetical protein